MGFRFRRSVKIAPGIRWNFSKTGTSWSVGGRGFTTNFRKGRITRTVGIPGTGVSFRQDLTPGRRPLAVAARASSPPADPSYWPGRFGAPEHNRTRTVTGWSAAGLALASIAMPPLVMPLAWAGAILSLGVCLAQPSPQTLVSRELGKRKSSWAEAVNSWDTNGGLPEVQRLLRKFEELELMPQEVGGSLTTLKATADLLTFEQQAGDKLTSIPNQEAIVDDDACFFVCDALYDKRGPNDETGALYITDRRVIFAGTSLLAIPWSKVFSTQREQSTLQIQQRGRKTPDLFVCNDLGSAMKADFVIQNVRAATAQAGEP